MNVMQRENLKNTKTALRSRNDLVRRDCSLGIRGKTVPAFPYTTTANRGASIPKYQFDNETTTSKKFTMGPPLEPLRTAKRRLLFSTSSKPESSSSGPRIQEPRRKQIILANDSAVGDTSNDMCTPRNKLTAIRYISSSSRGGYSGNRSARSTNTSIVEPSVILAISEGRGMARGEIGMAAIDLRHPHLVLCQFSDTLLYIHTMTKINFYNPIEIIVPNTFCEGVQPNQLYRKIKDQYPLVTVTPVQRRHFNEAMGRQNIQTLCAPQYSAVYLQVVEKFYALTAAAAVLKYVEQIQCLVFARESLKIEYYSSENTMLIDVRTATQLELVQPLVLSAGQTCCLLGVLGPTYTMGGIRALRAAILQPSCNKEFIEARLDAIQDLIDNDSGLMVDLQDVIKKLAEIDKILFLCVDNTNQTFDKFGEAQLNQTLLLKTTIEMVPKLNEALNSAASGRLRAIKMDLENPHYNELAERIKKIIQDDAHAERGAMGSFQRCFAVKPNINGLLDVARRTYSELIEDMQKVVDQLAEQHNLPLKLISNTIKGFHIVLPLAPKSRKDFRIEDLPEIFIQVQNSGASVRMTTEDLVVMDHQAKESLNEIQKMSNIVISTLLKELRPFMPSLYKLCEDVAELDILLALAQASTIGSYIRPQFNSYLEIRNSVHPLLDYYSQVTPIPNDIFASPEHNFTIITGPNMGGKSIYIKQIAIVQIMAQVGCFLPATNAVVRLCDRIFSRIGFNDSVELNASTYVLEIKEVQHILKGLTPSSLVLIDELCRGTSTQEGTSVAWAICEELIHSDAFTFFTTHFMYLTRLEDLYFNVVNRHASVEEKSETEGSLKKLVYLHKIEPGATKVDHYGLALAAQTSLPEETIKLANELAQLIEKYIKHQEITTPQQNYEKLLYKLNANIQHELRKDTNSEEIIKTLITNFKKENLQLVKTLMQNRNDDITIDVTGLQSYDHINNSQGGCESISKININYNQTNSSKSLLYDACKKSINEFSIADIESVNTIKTTNELVNSVMNVDISTNQSNDLDIEMRYDETHSKLVENTLMPNNTVVNGDYFSDEPLDFNYMRNQNKSIEADEFCPRLNTIRKDITNTSPENSQNYINDIEMPTDDSDCYPNINENTNYMKVNESIHSNIAEALTQVIATYSESDSNEEIKMIHSDEELILETVNEIRYDLLNDVSIQDIILTPPAEFRDLISL
ncbi:hypothetical protein K1T71_007658 [Dendrolimus kikuchii]|uniref:Uncharacterized protein n=1 Tax=Dendrolimus kikuchii TaxID=765133 RepID=A0ACC1CXN9_9NEOP|nr:hypothetical protein K1T71_007658 [Dendrolimus kikuchii]